MFDSSNAALWSKRISYFTRGDLDIQSLAGNIIEQISKAAQVRNVISETTFESGAVMMDDYVTIS